MIQNVTLDRLNAFLQQSRGRKPAGEDPPGSRSRPRFDNKEMLDASVTVGTFKPTS